MLKSLLGATGFVILTEAQDPKVIKGIEEEESFWGPTENYKAIITPEEELLMEQELELYTDIVENGCFYCSTASTSIELNRISEHCVDVCEDNLSLIDKTAWQKTFDQITFGQVQGKEIDSLCSQVILSAIADVVRHGQSLDANDVTHFAESLIFDERSGICWAYDPRDAGRRRLQ